MEVWGGNGPAHLPLRLPGNDVFVSCRPWRGQRAGGDIYYLSNCMSGIITRFVLADIAGHGEGSSDLAITLRRLMRKHINTVDQSAFARALNRDFGELASVGRFATALIATYFAPTDELILCNAGHPPPLHFRAADARWQLLTHESPPAGRAGVPDLPLGIIEPTTYHQYALRLDPNDVVVMYTDALIEAPAASGGPLGPAGLLALCDGIPTTDPAALAENILSRVRAAGNSAELDDDATVMVLRHNARNPPRPSLLQRARAVGRWIGLN